MYSKITTDSSYSLNNQFKAQILGKMLIISVIFTLFFAILDSLKINHVGHIQAINNYIHALFVFPVYVLFKQKKVNLTFTAIYFLCFCFMTSGTALFFATHDGFRAIWFFLSTIIAFVFLGDAAGKIYGYSAMLFVAVAGFFLENNMNATSAMSTLISLLVLILVVSAYTAHMHKHLERAEKVQQELYYLANKSEIFNSLAADKKSADVEKLLVNAQQANHDFSLVYIEFSYHHLHGDKTTSETSEQLLKEQNEKLISVLKNLISRSDVISSINDNLLYIAAPNKNEFSIKLMTNKIFLYFDEYGINFQGKRIDVSLNISITSLHSTDIGMRALHIRADKGLTKIKSSDIQKIIFVDV